MQTESTEDRRKHWRYPCIGEAVVRTPGVDVSLPGRLSDVSLGGCYLDMMNPLPSETDIELTLHVGDTQVRAKGRVHASRQGFGMGIAFTEVVGQDRTSLMTLINSLAGWFPLGPKLDPESVKNNDESTTIELRTAHNGSCSNSLNLLEPLLELPQQKGVITREERQNLTSRTDS
jgi:hypothetical protein